MEIADRAGLEALTMRALGDKLGVSAMSLYRYVPGKAELLDLLLEQAYAELPNDLPDEHWERQLKRVALDAWELYTRHPWMLDVSTYRASLGPHSIRKYERELSAVANAGLSDLDMDLVVAAVADYVRGAARGMAESRSAAQVTGRSDAEWWAMHSDLLRQLVDPIVFPLATRIGEKAGAEYGGTTDPRRSFNFGLARLIAGVRVMVEHKK
jgi:AcrR family transcriptional regulator